jgi:hypothetical protein
MLEQCKKVHVQSIVLEVIDEKIKEIQHITLRWDSLKYDKKNLTNMAREFTRK